MPGSMIAQGPDNAITNARSSYPQPFSVAFAGDDAITTRRQPSPGRGLPPAAGTNDTTVRVWLSRAQKDHGHPRGADERRQD
jgi:hypothetical protein